jgi:hypothetical protein
VAARSLDLEGNFYRVLAVAAVEGQPELLTLLMAQPQRDTAGPKSPRTRSRPHGTSGLQIVDPVTVDAKLFGVEGVAAVEVGAHEDGWGHAALDEQLHGLNHEGVGEGAAGHGR